MDDSQIASAGTSPAAELDQVSKHIYDTLMGMIETDLTTSAIPLLTQKYQNETPEERAERLARYEEAYKNYDIVYAQWLQGFLSDVRIYKRTALQSAEEKSRMEEASVLNQLVASFGVHSPDAA